MTGVPPIEEKDAIVGGFTPNAGVFEYRTAPTAIAPAEFADLPVLMFHCYVLQSSVPRNTMYLKFTFVLPAARTITMLVDVFAVTVNGNT
ncbi:MAG: hypothetical protein IPL69_20145 [Saprospiraceae bacterium]|nr:hypothetical protein [Candidatus Brachybacter algidus]